MPRKKTNQKKQKQETKGIDGSDVLDSRATEQNMVGPTYNLVHCNNVQIGDSNTMVSDVSDGRHPNGQAVLSKDHDVSTSREDYGILFLKDVLTQCQHPATYTEFETKVVIKLQSLRFNNFRELSGWHLDHFVIKHKDTFEVFSKKQNKCIRTKGKYKILSEQTENVRQEVEKIYSSPNENDEAAEGIWEEVQTRGTKARLRKEKKHIDENRTLHLRSLADFDSGKFVKLLEKGQCIDIMHVSDQKSYLDDAVLFSLDIVSMWNTPKRFKSYILIGIASNNKLGISEPLDDIFWQEHFQSKYFTIKPSFVCKTAIFEEKLFGVIEIGSSYGTGGPSVVKEMGITENYQLEKESIWIRKDHKNVLINNTDTNINSVIQWFSGNTCKLEGDTECLTSSRINEPDKLQPSNSEYFWKAVRGFQKGHFILIAGDIPNSTKHLEAIALPPWVAVYDFDIFSSTDGLLNIAQDKLEKTRNLKMRTWKEPTESLSEHGTLWCFMRGRKEIPDSRTDSRDGSIEDTSIWMKMVKSSLYSNCDSLVRFTEDYTVLTIVLLWPRTESLLPFMLKALDRMYEALSCPPNIVVCTNNQTLSEVSKTRLQIICDDFSTNFHKCSVDFEDLFQVFNQNMSENVRANTKFSLPILNTDYKTSSITEMDAAWMRDDFEVLYLECPSTRCTVNEDALEEEIDEFYKGGNLHWFAWYECSKSSEQSIIERSKQKSFEEKIMPLLHEYKTTVITLLHAPGSGGTTFAQAILWKLHRKVPCVHMKLRTGSSTDEIMKKVSFLYEKTGLAVVVLIDGEDESKVRYLSRRLKYAVILYVKRYPYAIESCDSKDKMFISGVLTPEEATKLASKLSEKHIEKKKALGKLKEDICKNGINHYLFEFGMTVHLHEFKGIVSYVAGYMQLDDRKYLFDLSPGQKCLGYLALVYFYGQTSVPCQFFASLFGKLQNYFMALDDFPHPIQEFVVYDKNESKQNNIRICHYFVAKEILEQILVFGKNQTKRRGEELSFDACRNLKKFCEDFIEYAGKRKSRNLAMSSKMRMVLTKTFIFRDEKDMSENEDQPKRKPVLSKLMSDIPIEKTLFTERLDILKKLTSSFPDDPNFCAHLGRFYAFCRSDEKEAEQCFKTAINLCERMRQGKTDDEMDEGIKLSLMHIYHMYGVVKLRCVSNYIKNSRTNTAFWSDESLFYESLDTIIFVAEEACELFRQSRIITPDTYQQYLYAFTGEIQTRLHVCDYIIQYAAKKFQRKTIPSFLESNAQPKSKEFVQQSVLIIENLILECYTDVDLFGDDTGSLQKKISWYNSLFQRKIISGPVETSSGSISHRRLKIAEKKLKYGIGSVLTSIENVTEETDIGEIIAMYEQIFDDVRMHGLQLDYGKTDLERDYRDWILGIRNENFKKNYSLEYVYSYVEKWHSMVLSPLATFYKFVLQSLLGFGSKSFPGKPECLQSALILKDSLEKLSHLVIRPKYPREWFGISDSGIKQLVPGKRHIGVSSERSNDTTLHNYDLLICKGTIMHPNTHRLSGRIDFNTGLHSVIVFFIPKFVGLEGKRYVNHRVEFVLGFSLEHGYEAYKVKLLKRYGCSKCNTNIEFTSAENDLLCKCGNRVYRDELSLVKDISNK